MLKGWDEIIDSRVSEVQGLIDAVADGSKRIRELEQENAKLCAMGTRESARLSALCISLKEENAKLRAELERRTLKWTSEPMRVGLYLVRDKRYRQPWLMNNITDGATLQAFSEHAGPIEPPEEL